MSETAKSGQNTTFLTFDLPLHMKCRDIVAALNLLRVVVRLGGFHLLMSFLGAIGIIMAGSGLEALWAVAFAGESIKKMMDGHNFARSLRAHILTFTALGILVCESIEEKDEFKKKIATLLKQWEENHLRLHDSDANRDLKEMSIFFMQNWNS